MTTPEIDPAPGAAPQSEAAKAIEAILMVAQEPVETHLLAQLLEVAPATVDALCAELQASYAAEDRGFVLARVAGGYRFQSHGDLAPYVERFVLEGQSARLSSAALETLAIVAYKQPLSRAQVAAIRGVNVDGVMRTLHQRGYVVEVGRDPGPGQATLFGTSREFLERLGLDSIEDLPPIADLFPSPEVMEALERGLRADTGDRLPLDLTTPPPAVHRDDVVDHGEVRTGLPVEPTDREPVDDLSPPAWAVEEPARPGESDLVEEQGPAEGDEGAGPPVPGS